VRTLEIDETITPAEVAAALAVTLAPIDDRDAEQRDAEHERYVAPDLTPRAVVKISDYTFPVHVAELGGVTKLTRAKLTAETEPAELAPPSLDQADETPRRGRAR
jgi:hypothetical protein